MSAGEPEEAPYYASDADYGWTPDKASCFSRIWNGWATPIVRKGAQRPLTDDDLPSTPSWLRSSELHPKAIRAWEKETARAAAVKEVDPTSKKARPSVFAVCRAVGGRNMDVGSGLLALHGLLNAVVRPLLLRLAVGALNDSTPTWKALTYAGALSLTLLFESWSKVQGMHYAGDLSVLQMISSLMQVRDAICRNLRVSSLLLLPTPSSPSPCLTPGDALSSRARSSPRSRRRRCARAPSPRAMSRQCSERTWSAPPSSSASCP